MSRQMPLLSPPTEFTMYKSCLHRRRSRRFSRHITSPAFDIIGQLANGYIRLIFFLKAFSEMNSRRNAKPLIPISTNRAMIRFLLLFILVAACICFMALRISHYGCRQCFSARRPFRLPSFKSSAACSSESWNIASCAFQTRRPSPRG